MSRSSINTDPIKLEDRAVYPNELLVRGLQNILVELRRRAHIDMESSLDKTCSREGEFWKKRYFAIIEIYEKTSSITNQKFWMDTNG